MGQKYILRGILLLILMAPLQSQAEVLPYVDVIDELNYLLNQKDYESAYQMAELYAFEYGGEVDFDLLFGFAAFGSKRFQEAVFAFERVAVLRPNNFTGRFFLAQSYHKLKNYAAATRELDKLRKTQLTPQQLANIDSLQRRIERNLLRRQRTWSHAVAVNLSYDSNVNSGTDKDVITIPNFGEIALFDASKETSDMGYHVSYVGGYQHPLDQNRTLKLDYSYNYYGFAEFNQYQRQQAAVNLAYQHKLPYGTVSVSGYVKPMWLELETKTETIDDIITEPQREVALYRTESGLNASYQYPINPNFSVSLGSQLALMSNNVNPELDFTRVKLNTGLQYRSALLQMVNVHWYQDTSSEDLSYNDRAVHGLMYMINVPIIERLTSSSYVMYESHSYDQAHPIFQQVRDESLVVASSQLNFQYSKQQRFKAQLNLQQKQSNVELFNFDRFEVVVGWQFTF